MKRLHTLAAYVVVLMLAGVASLKAEQPGKMAGKAIVRTVHGSVSFSVGGISNPLTPNMELDPGTTITTGPDAWVDLSINGVSSALRVAADTTLLLDTMNRIGPDREGDTETMLDLKAGTILGQVKKVSANSTYEIKTPHGVAGIRGTEYTVTVVALADGQYEVTFTSDEGLLTVSAVVNGNISTKTLNGGESWTVGGEVVPVKIELLQWQLDQINAMINDIAAGIMPPPVPFGQVIIIYPVFPVGFPPGKGPSSPFGPVFPFPIHPHYQITGSDSGDSDDTVMGGFSMSIAAPID